LKGKLHRNPNSDMDNFDLSVQRFNEFVHEYAERFKNLTNSISH